MDFHFLETIPYSALVSTGLDSAEEIVAAIFHFLPKSVRWRISCGSAWPEEEDYIHIQVP